MDQIVVMDQQDNLDVYRNWNHCYSQSAITKLMNGIGFHELNFFSDVAGKECDDTSETLCVAGKKK